MAAVATKRKKGKNGFWSDLVGPKTTIRHVKTGAVSTSKSRYKGYTIFKEKSGDFSIPGLDKSSAFDTLRDAKRFVDSQTKAGMVNRKKVPNAKTKPSKPSHAKRTKASNSRFAALGTVGRKTRQNSGEHVASMSLGGAAAEVYATGSHAFKAVVKWGKQTSEKVFKGFKQAMEWAREQVQKLGVGRTKNVDPLTAASLLNTYGPRVGKGLDKAGAKLGREFSKMRLSNPMDSAARLYEEFHGAPSKEVLEYVQQEHYHSVLSGVGPLISMKVLNVFETAEMLLEFPDPANSDIAVVVQLCSSEDGRQLYLVGGDQELGLAKMKGNFGLTNADVRDKMLLGTITQITYRTKKSFELGGTEEIDFFHDLDDKDAIKENGGVLPVLEYRPLNPSIEIVGGRYKIAKPVKELGGVSPGIVG